MKKTEKRWTAIMICLCLMISMLSGITLEAKKSVGKQTLSKSTLSLYKGQSAKLSVKNRKGKKVIFSTNKRRVVKVSKSGKVTAKKSGTAIVYAKVKGGKKLACKVKVGEYLQSMTLRSAGSVVLKMGSSSQIKTRVVPSKSLYTSCTYNSSDKNIVTVSNTGKMIAKGTGLVTITVTTKAMTKKRKKIRKSILVFVEEKEAVVPGTPAPTPNVPPSTSTGVITIIGTPTPSTTPMVSPQPGQPTPTATPTPEPKTLLDLIHEIPTPASNQLIAAQYVVSDSTSISTLYFLNMNYVGKIGISLNGKSFSSGENINTVLTELATRKYAGWNSASTIHVNSTNYADSQTKQVYWIIDEYNTAGQWLAQYTFKAYQMNANQLDPIYGSPYGLIVADGDVSKTIVFQ